MVSVPLATAPTSIWKQFTLRDRKGLFSNRLDHEPKQVEHFKYLKLGKKEVALIEAGLDGMFKEHPERNNKNNRPQDSKFSKSNSLLLHK